MQQPQIHAATVATVLADKPATGTGAHCANSVNAFDQMYNQRRRRSARQPNSSAGLADEDSPRIDSYLANAGNVKQLQVAWTFSPGLVHGHEAAPLVVDDTMYIVTPCPNYLYTPLAVKDKVFVGNSGGELGVRGWLTALDVKTGKQVWRACSTVLGFMAVSSGGSNFSESLTLS